MLESVDPAIIMKMMFLLFYDNVASERELMRIIQYRLDYMWFLGYGLDDEIPNHSVLSKARKRWGPEVFEKLFIRVVGQCVVSGLVEGKKIHVDSSLVDANASKDSVFKAKPEFIAALKAAYRVQEEKFECHTPERYEAVNERMISTTDPDASCVRKGGSDSARPRYHHHRVVDDANGVITAVETTPGKVAESHKLMSLGTRASYGRTIHRHEHQELLDQARQQAASIEGKRDHLRRKYLMEGSIADASNNHGFKRSRWRRLWRQNIQDFMIATIQNIRILIGNIGGNGLAQAVIREQITHFFNALTVFVRNFFYRHLLRPITA